jgi:hypothetical protein
MTELYVFRGTAIGEVEEGVLEGFWGNWMRVFRDAWNS